MIEKIHPVFLVGCLSCAFLTGALAQTSETTPQSDDKDGSYIRGWIAGNGGSEAVSLWAQSAKDEEPRLFASAAAGEKVVNPSYTKGVAGSFQFQIRSGEKILQSAKAELAENAAYTVLAWRQDDQWEFEVYADGPFAKSVVDRPLRLMNFAEKRETLISIDNGPETKIAANRVEEFKVSAKLTSFTVKVLAADGGAPAESSGEVDFGVVPSAYVVIAPDYRGRMRPRVVAGGNLPSLEE
jgi:hypothetical protein